MAAKRGDRLELFAGRVGVKLSVATVGDVKRSLRKVDRFGRKRVFAIDDAMKLAAAVEHIQHVVFVVGDVEIAAVVVNHAFRFRNPVVSPQKFRDLSVARHAKYFVHFAIADQKRSIRRQRDAFSRNQSFVFTGHESRFAIAGKFPKSA